MTHVSEERNVEAPADVIFAILADPAKWPLFYRTLDGRVRATHVSHVSGRAGEKGARRRVRFEPWGDWVEELHHFDANERLAWHGVETPGVKGAKTLIELVPGRGYTTLRWDLFVDLAGVPLFSRSRKRVKRALEEMVLAALVEVDRLAMRELAARARAPAAAKR